jgi:hypothetical protein
MGVSTKLLVIKINSLLLSITPLRRIEEWSHSNTFLTLKQNGISGQFHAPAVLPPGKEPPVQVGRLGSGVGRKIPGRTGNRTLAVQLPASE